MGDHPSATYRVVIPESSLADRIRRIRRTGDYSFFAGAFFGWLDILMDDLGWILRAGFLETRLYDLPNFMACVVLVLLGNRLFKVPVSHQFVLLLHCFLPFFLYGGVISYDYMPDVMKYWRAFNEIRSGSLSLDEAFLGGNVEQAALLFSLFPLPFAVTPISLGFFNVIIYVSMYFWLLSRNIFTPASVWFYLLYPSFALYSGLGLRDTLIFAFMAFAVQWARENRLILVFLALWLLFLIKFQNAFILGGFLLFCVVFRLFRTGVSLRKAVVVTIAGVAVLVLVAPVVLPEVNHFRIAMYLEDGGDPNAIETISGVKDFVLAGIGGSFYFLLKPLPWEVSGFFQIVQSVENIIIFMFLVMLVMNAWRTDSKKLILWILFIIFAFTIYGLVVFNYGTAARYRFPFIVLFVLFVCEDCRIYRLFRLRVGKKYSSA